MAKNDLTALRDHMFEVIERLKSNSDPEASECERIDVETAKAVTNAAQTIVHSAKVEIEFLKLLAKTDDQDKILSAAKERRFLAQYKEL